MKQGMTRKLVPKDKHSKASWKKRDEGRKGKQEDYLVQQDREGDSLTAAIELGYLDDEQATTGGL